MCVSYDKQTFVSIQVNIAIGCTTAPQVLTYFMVLLFRGSNESVIAHKHTTVKLDELRRIPEKDTKI
jgi:hypothetical protein